MAIDKILEEKLKNSTPTFQAIEKFEDADDEMLFIAEHIKKTTTHNEYIEPERIKYLYTGKPKKDGSCYTLFDLSKRSDIDKMINADYDFILTVFYDVWKVLTPEQKVMTLDKALCGIDMGNMEKQKIGKKAPDSKEFIDNMRFYGPDKVMETSEIIDLACINFISDKADEKRAAKEGAKKGKKKVFTSGID